MVIKYRLAAAILSLSCVDAFAQVTFATQVTGMFNRDTEIAGLLSATAGSGYTMEVSSVFPETVPWQYWPDAISTYSVPSTVVLAINGVTHQYSGTGRMTLRVGSESQGTANQRVTYIVELPPTTTQPGLSFTNYFYLAPESGIVTLLDLFESGQNYPVATDASVTSSLWLFPPGERFGHHLGTNVASFSYYTSGLPVATAVPEPATAAMLLAGMTLLGASARRRTR